MTNDSCQSDIQHLTLAFKVLNNLWLEYNVRKIRIAQITPTTPGITPIILEIRVLIMLDDNCQIDIYKLDTINCRIFLNYYIENRFLLSKLSTNSNGSFKTDK